MTEIKSMPFYETYTLEQVLHRQISYRYKTKLQRFIIKWIVGKLIPRSFRESPMQEFMKMQKGARIGRMEIHLDYLDDVPTSLDIEE